MPGLVRTSHFSSGQPCQIRTGWSGQNRSRGSGHLRTVLVRSSQSSLVGLVRSGQACSVRSGQDMSVPERSGQVDQVTLPQVRSGQVWAG